MSTVASIEPSARRVLIPASASLIRWTSDRAVLEGELRVPRDAAGLVVFAHGCGSDRFSPRNQFVARQLRGAGLATLLLDLLTVDEAAVDARSSWLRFDVDFLVERLTSVVMWVRSVRDIEGLRLGILGTSTGAAAALVTAARLGDRVGAVVSRGRPDLAGPWLARVAAPTLLVAGGRDLLGVEFNRRALALLRCERNLAIVPGATHLLGEPGALEQMTALATGWFRHHIRRAGGACSAA